MVFVFFGLVAVVGTTYVQSESFDLPALYAGSDSAPSSPPYWW